MTVKTFCFRGGSAVVHRAVSKATGKSYAVKKMNVAKVPKRGTYTILEVLVSTLAVEGHVVTS